MNKRAKYLIFIVLCILQTSCGSGRRNGESDSYERKYADPLDGVRIAWDYSSLQQLAPKGGYPRLYRLKDHSLAVVYENWNGDAVLIRSNDEGQNWTSPFVLFSRHLISNQKGTSVVNCSNPEIIQLENNDILVACNYRPVTFEITPFSIAIRRSTDNGNTWNNIQVIYNAQARFTDGCWEPSFLQLPNGEVQVYFANENHYTSSDEQEISVMSSSDNGITFNQIKQVSFRKNRRDGMPIPRIVNDEIVVAIEDNNKDAFKPYTVRCKISENWTSPILADSKNREYALAEKIADKVYMGAPYLLVLPSGETLLSYQTNQNRDSDWEHSTMEVAIGNRLARNFTKRTQPFKVALDKEAKWNSIALWDNSTIVALSTTNFKSVIAPWMIKGYIIQEIKVNTSEISTFPIFIGAESVSNLKAGIGVDNSNLYIKCNINDPELVNPQKGTQNGDGVYILIDAKNASLLEPDKGIYKLWISYKGDPTFWRGEKGTWIKEDNSLISIIPIIFEGGYNLEITIPKKLLIGINDQSIRMGFALSNYTTSNTGKIESLVLSEMEKPNTWLRIDFK